MSSGQPATKQAFIELLSEVFLIEPSASVLDLKKDDIETWDSLGTVSLAVGIDEEFGYHMTPDEATGLESIADLISLLEQKGVHLS